MNLSTVTAIMATLLNSSSVAATKTCFTDAEFSDVLLVIAPSALRSIEKKCSTQLANASVLGRPHSATARKLDAASAEAWPKIWPTIKLVAMSDGVRVNAADDTMTRADFEKGIAPFLANIVVKQADCHHVDRMLTLVEPLSATSMSQFFVEFLRLQSSGREVQFLCSQQ